VWREETMRITNTRQASFDDGGTMHTEISELSDMLGAVLEKQNIFVLNVIVDNIFTV
jgi:hypothetical protein